LIPSNLPTPVSSEGPSFAPSEQPTTLPTALPSRDLSEEPSLLLTRSLSFTPTILPTQSQTDFPTTRLPPASTSSQRVAMFEQCGQSGPNEIMSINCIAGSYCAYSSVWWSSCQPCTFLPVNNQSRIAYDAQCNRPPGS